MSETFCGVCRHPTGDGIGHYPNCPVLTGIPVAGAMPPGVYPGINPQESQQQPRNMLGSLAFMAQDGYEVAKIYKEARGRILEELAIQVDINHRQGRELIDLRLKVRELLELQIKPAPVPEADKPWKPVLPPQATVDDDVPF
jgi:hypothetical protein